MSTQQAPLFPLSNVTLFPRASVPLHLFEPRYRQMMEAALEGNRVIAMATARPEHASDMAGDPPVYPIACAGFVQSYQKLADGRFNLVLQGTHRVRIVSEQPPKGERLYRVGELEPLEDSVVDAGRCAELRERVTAHLADLARQATGVSLEHTVGRLQTMDLAAFTDGVCQAVALPTTEKQSLLEADTLDDRLVRLEGTLAFHRAMMERGGADSGPETVH